MFFCLSFRRKCPQRAGRGWTKVKVSMIEALIPANSVTKGN
jgi:hypothetical protein